MGLSEKEKKALSKVNKLCQISVLQLDKKKIGVQVHVDPNADLLKIVGALSSWMQDATELLHKNKMKATGLDLSLYMESKKTKTS